jgi:ribosome-associated protein
VADAKPSKSERKRTQHALQALGEDLLSLPEEMLAELELEEQLKIAIADLRRMKSHEAVRRQKQYIGKLMRNVDPAPIKEILDRLGADERRVKRLFARAEQWRDRVLRERHQAVEAFEGETGQSGVELSRLVSSLEHAVSDSTERGIQRQIFREIHRALAASAGDG